MTGTGWHPWCVPQSMSGSRGVPFFPAGLLPCCRARTWALVPRWGLALPRGPVPPWDPVLTRLSVPTWSLRAVAPPESQGGVRRSQQIHIHKVLGMRVGHSKGGTSRSSPTAVFQTDRAPVIDPKVCEYSSMRVFKPLRIVVLTEHLKEVSASPCPVHTRGPV